MKPFFKSLLVTPLLAAMTITQPASAEDGTPWWITLGGGAISAETELATRCDVFLGAREAVSWQKGGGLWTVMISNFIAPEFLGKTRPREFAYDFGALYGKRWVARKLGFVSASVGIAYVVGMSCSQYAIHNSSGELIGGEFHYEEKPFETVGVPTCIQLCLAPIRYFGLSLDIFGNLNPERSFGGATLSLVAGKLW